MKLRNKTEGILNFLDYKRVRFKLVYILIFAILVLAVLIAVVPVLWLFISSFKTVQELNSIHYTLFPAKLDLGKIKEVWEMANLTKYFINTLIVMLMSVVFSVVFNGLLAYVIGILKPKGYKIVFYAIMAAYMIPPITSIVPLMSNIANLGFAKRSSGYLSYLPITLIFGANAFYFVNFKNYFENLPKPLFEAARMDGCNDFRMFFSLLLPLSKPIIGVVAIFTMTASFGDFLLPYLLLKNDQVYTVMVKLYSVSATPPPGYTTDKILMLVSLSIVPQIIIFIIFQKQITGSVATTGIKE